LEKGRYSPVSHYISYHEYVTDNLNDTQKLKICPKLSRLMMKAGLDERLAYHIGALFERSPVPAYERELEFPEEYSRWVECSRHNKKCEGSHEKTSPPKTGTGPHETSPPKIELQTSVNSYQDSEETKSAYSFCDRE
jgi:hypothetical protein